MLIYQKIGVNHQETAEVYFPSLLLRNYYNIMDFYTIKGILHVKVHQILCAFVDLLTLCQLKDITKTKM